jgi:hypothetical protein
MQWAPRGLWLLAVSGVGQAVSNRGQTRDRLASPRDPGLGAVGENAQSLSMIPEGPQITPAKHRETVHVHGFDLWHTPRSLRGETR